MGRDLDDWVRGFFSGSGRIGLPHWEEVEEVGSMKICQDNLRKCEEKWRGSWQNNLRELKQQHQRIQVREYQIPQGAKVREVGPLVYGYSMTIGQDGKPKVREFGNIRPSSRLGEPNSSWTVPLISGEREPLVRCHNYGQGNQSNT